MPNGRAGELMATIESRGSTSFRTFDMEPATAVNLDRPQKLQPDASWGQAGHDYPGLAVEVAYSQTGESLVEKMNKVLGYSGGLVRYVIGVNIGYPGPLATVQVWRSVIVTGQDTSLQLELEAVRRPNVSTQRLNRASRLDISYSGYIRALPPIRMLVSLTPVG